MKNLTQELIYQYAPDIYDVIDVSTGPGSKDCMVELRAYYSESDVDDVILVAEFAKDDINSICYILSLVNSCYLYCREKNIQLTSSFLESYIGQIFRDLKLNQILTESNE